MSDGTGEARQGDVFWIDFDEPSGPEARFRRPHVVVQSDTFIQPRIRTVIVCPVTSNPRRTSIPGNVERRAGEGGLPVASVVEVGRLFTVNVWQLGEWVGRLPDARIREAVAGIQVWLQPRSDQFAE